MPGTSTDCVFCFVDNCSWHRGRASCERLRQAYRNATLVHTSVHASWLNHFEIYFSIVQRKILVPNDFQSLADVAHRLLAFQDYYMHSVKPFSWNFDGRQLSEFTIRLAHARCGRLRAECMRMKPHLHL